MTDEVDDRNGPSAGQPLVSVVLPTYERAPALQGAIDSVLDQTYDEVELIVVDGGSTDGTRAVVESVEDPHLTYVRRDSPRGVSAARNLGIDRSNGDLVAFVDADDRWRPEKLREQVSALRGSPPEYGVAYCGIGKRDGEPIARAGASGDVREDLRHLAVPTYTSTLLARRGALERVGGFDESLPCFEDWELCLRLSRDCAFAYVDEPLVEKGAETPGENVSADPANLAIAVDRLFARYDLPRDARARLLADVGATYCESGGVREGRRYLARAVRLDPTRLNPIAAYLFSLTGSDAAYGAGMGGVYAFQRRLRRFVGAGVEASDGVIGR
ncbi:glycosyltransferase family 2 protein [Halovivax limisalsi]|uniref:glycosyltransferase family 2 protein n=1 Tax=Halovivax limisalsi TaxID=1453760 RepID=UPI001FFCFDB3|nr:glycosyltransferase [Halovivax limisalsi]